MRGPLLTALWFPLGQILFGLFLFGCLPVKPPRWLTQGAGIDPIISNPEMARVLFLSLLTVVSVGPFIWIDAARLRRRFPLCDLAPMAKMILSSRRGAMTFVVLALFVGQTAWFIFRGVPISSYFVRINLLIACGVLMIILVPPAGMVLGSSTVSGPLLETVARHFFPFRTVSLLDGRCLGPTIFANKNDNLRTILGGSWRDVVHRLVELTRLVVVDARSATPAVCDEIRYMLEPSRVGKAVFVVNDDGSTPGIDAVSVDTRHLSLVCCAADDVPQVIATFKRRGTVSSVTRPSEFCWQSTTCAECGRPMRVLVHRKHGLGVVPMSGQLMKMMDEGKVKGSFCCRQCNRCYCYACSDIEKNCKCGKNAGWGETVYMDM